jgi:hypothetical protein
MIAEGSAVVSTGQAPTLMLDLAAAQIADRQRAARLRAMSRAARKQHADSKS